MKLTDQLFLFSTLWFSDWDKCGPVCNGSDRTVSAKALTNSVSSGEITRGKRTLIKSSEKSGIKAFCQGCHLISSLCVWPRSCFSRYSNWFPQSAVRNPNCVTIRRHSVPSSESRMTFSKSWSFFLNISCRCSTSMFCTWFLFLIFCIIPINRYIGWIPLQ